MRLHHVVITTGQSSDRHSALLEEMRRIVSRSRAPSSSPAGRSRGCRSCPGPSNTAPSSAGPGDVARPGRRSLARRQAEERCGESAQGHVDGIRVTVLADRIGGPPTVVPLRACTVTLCDRPGGGEENGPAAAAGSFGCPGSGAGLHRPCPTAAITSGSAARAGSTTDPGSIRNSGSSGSNPVLNDRLGGVAVRYPSEDEYDTDTDGSNPFWTPELPDDLNLDWLLSNPGLRGLTGDPHRRDDMGVGGAWMRSFHVSWRFAAASAAFSARPHPASDLFGVNYGQWDRARSGRRSGGLLRSLVAWFYSVGCCTGCCTRFGPRIYRGRSAWVRRGLRR
ncbi:MAG: hypothetical protein JWO67_5477 [Streptosporangiaceae bacterium]|nr:hypothetical protein [Streptosporangiaceae bacterium]